MQWYTTTQGSVSCNLHLHVMDYYNLSLSIQNLHLHLFVSYNTRFCVHNLHYLQLKALCAYLCMEWIITTQGSVYVIFM